MTINCKGLHKELHWYSNGQIPRVKVLIWKTLLGQFFVKKAENSELFLKKTRTTDTRRLNLWEWDIKAKFFVEIMVEQ